MLSLPSLTYWKTKEMLIKRKKYHDILLKLGGLKLLFHDSFEYFRPTQQRLVYIKPNGLRPEKYCRLKHECRKKGCWKWSKELIKKEGFLHCFNSTHSSKVLTDIPSFLLSKSSSYDDVSVRFRVYYNFETNAPFWIRHRFPCLISWWSSRGASFSIRKS